MLLSHIQQLCSYDDKFTTKWWWKYIENIRSEQYRSIEHLIFDTGGNGSISYIQFIALHSFVNKCLMNLDIDSSLTDISFGCVDLKKLLNQMDLEISTSCCDVILNTIHLKSNTFHYAMYCCGLVAQLRSVFETCSTTPYSVESFSKFVKWSLLLID
ncbi:hypothetical protein QTN25_004297 [Entamoeba marina]